MGNQQSYVLLEKVQSTRPISAEKGDSVADCLAKSGFRQMAHRLDRCEATSSLPNHYACNNRYCCPACAKYRREQIARWMETIYVDNTIDRLLQQAIDPLQPLFTQLLQQVLELEMSLAQRVPRRGLEATKKALMKQLGSIKPLFRLLEALGVPVYTVRNFHGRVSERIRDSKQKTGGLQRRRILTALHRLRKEINHLAHPIWQVLTLTVRATHPRKEIAQLKKAIAQQWRQRWKGSTAGMLSMIQQGKRGHLHAHLLFLGPPLNHRSLREEWRVRTGATEIKVEPLRDGAEGVLRWIRYGLGFGDVPPELRALAYPALRGRRQIEWYGVLKKVNQVLKEEKRHAMEMSQPRRWEADLRVRFRADGPLPGRHRASRRECGTSPLPFNNHLTPIQRARAPTVLACCVTWKDGVIKHFAQERGDARETGRQQWRGWRGAEEGAEGQGSGMGHVRGRERGGAGGVGGSEIGEKAALLRALRQRLRWAEGGATCWFFGK